MSEALRRITEVVGEATEDEVAAALNALGVARRRQRHVQDTPRTPLPPHGGSPGVPSEVEWV